MLKIESINQSYTSAVSPMQGAANVQGLAYSLAMLH